MSPSTDGEHLAAALSGTSISGGAVPQTAQIPMELTELSWTFFIRVYIRSVPNYNLPPLFGYLEQDIRTVCQNCQRDAWGNQETMLFMVKCNRAKFEEVIRRMKITMKNFGGIPDHIEYYLAGEAGKP